MKVSCPFCHQHYEIDAPTPNKKYKCLYCGEQFTGGDAPSVEAVPENASVPKPIPAAAPPVGVSREVEAAPHRRSGVVSAVAWIVMVLLMAWLAWVLLPLRSDTRDLQRQIAAMRDENQQLRTLVETLQANQPKAASAPSEITPEEWDKLKEQLDVLSQTQGGIRAWQSKYTATLDQLTAMVEKQTLEQAFAQVHVKINELYAPQGAFAKVYYAITQLSQAANDNLIILNQNVTSLTQYTGQLADNIDKLNDEFDKVNRDLGNIFGRLNRLERNNGTYIYVSPIRPTPKPCPRPPQPRAAAGISVNINN